MQLLFYALFKNPTDLVSFSAKKPCFDYTFAMQTRANCTTKVLTIQSSKTMAEIYQIPENNGNCNNGFNGIPFSIPVGGFGMGGLGMGGFGGLGNGFGCGMNGLAELFGFAIIASMFGFNGNGNGMFGGGNGANSAAYFANMVSNDTGRELLQNAITSQGEASRTAIQSLSTMIGQDFSIVNSAIQNIQNSLCQIANQQGMSTLQVVNAIQAGNATLASQLAQCCCDNKLLTVEQTNQLQSAINFVNSSVERGFASTNYETFKQTCEISKAIETSTNRILDGQRAAEMREMQNKIDSQAEVITQLRNAENNASQTAQFAAMLAPIQAQVNAIAAKQPNTVPVQWPQLTAVNTTPNAGVGFGNGWWANGFGNTVVF